MVVLKKITQIGMDGEKSTAFPCYKGISWGHDGNYLRIPKETIFFFFF
jgi:hypothetical protein